VQLVAAAAVPNERAPLGIRCMDAGKHYFTDKTPLVSLAQLDDVKAAVARTGKKYMVYFSERLHVECAMHATDLIADGAIGKVVHVAGFGPHRMGDPCDIGSHQIEQFLTYAGCQDATVSSARVANYAHPSYPELEDFGDATLVGDNGATFYFRVDWFTPYLDVTTDHGADQLILVNGEGEQRMSLHGEVGFRFFGQLIRDCLDGTEHAMTQAHALKAAELCVKAQMAAEKLVTTG